MRRICKHIDPLGATIFGLAFAGYCYSHSRQHLVGIPMTTRATPNPRIDLPGWEFKGTKPGNIDFYRVNRRFMVGASCHDGGWILSVDPTRLYFGFFPLGFNCIKPDEYMPIIHDAFRHLGVEGWTTHDDVSVGAASVKFIDRRIWDKAKKQQRGKS